MSSDYKTVNYYFPALSTYFLTSLAEGNTALEKKNNYVMKFRI